MNLRQRRKYAELANEYTLKNLASAYVACLYAWDHRPARPRQQVKAAMLRARREQN